MIPGRAMAATQEQIRAAFAVFDADGSGTLSMHELKSILARPVRGRPPRFTEAEVNQILAKFDANGDGLLALDEFSRAFASLTRDKQQASLEQLMALVSAPADEAFADLVPEGAGCTIPKTEERAITLAQLEAVLKHVQRRCAKERWLDYRKEPLTPERASLYEVSLPCTRLPYPAPLAALPPLRSLRLVARHKPAPAAARCAAT